MMSIRCHFQCYYRVTYKPHCLQLCTHHVNFLSSKIREIALPLLPKFSRSITLRGLTLYNQHDQVGDRRGRLSIPRYSYPIYQCHGQDKYAIDSNYYMYLVLTHQCYNLQHI